MRKTKIIITLGPSTDNYETLKEILRIGVEGIRLNLAHYDEKEFENRIKILKKVLEELNKELLIFADLPGPQVRIRNVDYQVYVKKGDILGFTPNKKLKSEEKKIFYVDYQNFLEDIKKDDILLIDDGKIKVKIKEIDGEIAYGVALNNGIIKEGRKVIIQGKDFNIDSITEKDKWLIENVIKKYDIINGVALSFVRNRDSIKELKKLVGEKYIILSKIESVDGVKNIEEIADESDIILIARGDLGVVFDYKELPYIQKILIKKSRKKPVIVATETLSSLIENERPTRAEIDGLEKLFLEKIDGIMLTNETAIGKNPINVVFVANDLLKYIERIYFEKLRKEKEKEYYIYTNKLKFVRKYSKPGKNIAIYHYTSNKKLFLIANLLYGVESKYINNNIQQISDFLPIIKDQINSRYIKSCKLQEIDGNVDCILIRPI